MFSIITPLYNKAGYIQKALESVFAQTNQEFELIVVNDGSTDDSLKNLHFAINNLQLSEEKIKIIDQQNQGVSTARNNGVKVAKYDLIAFLDADDWWEPTYLEEMKLLIDAYPDAGIYGSNYFIVKNENKRIAPIGVAPGFKKGIVNYFRVYSKTLCMPLWTGATIIKKIIFDHENGFKSYLKLGEDFDLWVRVALKYPVALMNKPLANYNQDVDENERCVVAMKLYKPETHFIFNLDYLNNEEKKNSNLHKLLDSLRVYTLLRYRLQGGFSFQFKREIEKVDFMKQPLSVCLNYKLPVFLLVIWNKLRLRLGKYYKKIRRWSLLINC